MAQRLSTADGAFERYKTGLGVRMTVLYSLVYGGFVVLSVFAPSSLGARALFGLNVAVTYGLGLIFIAIVFAIVYNLLCRPRPGAAPGREE